MFSKLTSGEKLKSPKAPKEKGNGKPKKRLDFHDLQRLWGELRISLVVCLFSQNGVITLALFHACPQFFKKSNFSKNFYSTQSNWFIYLFIYIFSPLTLGFGHM